MTIGTGRDALRSFGPVTVPAGEYLMLGDNSKDSRYIGFVKRELPGVRVRPAVLADPANDCLRG